MSKTILITGGAGFVGSNLVERLLKGDPSELLRIVVFDSFSQGRPQNLAEFASDQRLRIVNGDVRDRNQVDNVTTGVDQIYHLSSIVGPDRYMESPLETIDVNITGTRNILECALKKDIRVLFSSTSEVLGMNPKLPWKEDDQRVLGSTRVERWSYGSSKAVCEHMVFALTKRHGLKCTVVRLFNAYGPKQHPSFLISRGVHRALRGDPPLTYDDGRHTRCHTYVDDIVGGLVLAADSTAALGEIFHLGSGTATSAEAVNEMIVEAVGKPGLRPMGVNTQEKYGDAYEDIPDRVPDSTKARQLLGWEATVPIREGIRRLVVWAQANPWWIALPER